VSASHRPESPDSGYFVGRLGEQRTFVVSSPLKEPKLEINGDDGREQNFVYFSMASTISLCLAFTSEKLFESLGWSKSKEKKSL
jgi:hypothetical protein